VTILSWNVNRRKNVVPQAELIARFAPDVIALQEIIGGSAPAWHRVLQEMGYRFIDSSLDLVSDEERKGPRQFGVLVAAKRPGKRLDPKIPLVWPERLLLADIEGCGPFLTTYVPPGVTNGWVKIDTLEHLWDIARAFPKGTCTVTGDLNAPQIERPDGTVATWGERIRKDGSTSLIASRGERWDRAERMFFESIAELGLKDAFRARHGFDAVDHSWAWRAKGRVVPYRFDHIFVCDDREVLDFQYVHEAIDLKLSDHSPAVVRLG